MNEKHLQKKTMLTWKSMLNELKYVADGKSIFTKRKVC